MQQVASRILCRFVLAWISYNHIFGMCARGFWPWRIHTGDLLAGEVGEQNSRDWLGESMRRLAILFCLLALPVYGQSNNGELHLKVTDPSGHGVQALLQITSEANQYQKTLTTNEQGSLAVQRLPFGIYQ